MKVGLKPPQLEHFATLEVTVEAPQEVGVTQAGQRRVIPITGGKVFGNGWQGCVLPGGADFQLIVSPRMAELDARYILETDAGERIYVVNQAIRVAEPDITRKLMEGEPVDPDLIYFRCTPRFETGAERFRWITESLFVGTGVRWPDSVELQFYRVL